MKTKLEVKTEERAIEIINSYLEKNDIEFGRLTGGQINCSCGQTESVNYIHNGTTLSVVVCDSCGSDDESDKDCLTVEIW